MANRYWVGGTASWNGTAASKWSTTSGGAGGSAEPTAADDVLFDAASGAVTVTVATSARPCRSLNFTGFTGTFAGTERLEIGDASAGNITLGSGMTYTATTAIHLVSTFAGTNTITSNGITGTGAWSFGSSAGTTWSLADAFVNTSAGSTSLGGGILTLNNQNMTVKVVDFSSGTFTMGSGTLTVSGTGSCLAFGTAASLTLNENTSTIVISDTSSSTKICDFGNSQTFNNITITGGGSGSVTVQNSPNCAGNFIIGPPKTVIFTAGITVTAGTFSFAGTAGNVITIQTETPGSAATLSKSSGTVSGTYMSIKDSTAAGGATFTATNSTNVSGNTGWRFVFPGAMFNVFEI